MTTKWRNDVDGNICSIDACSHHYCAARTHTHGPQCLHTVSDDTRNARVRQRRLRQSGKLTEFTLARFGWARAGLSERQANVDRWRLSGRSARTHAGCVVMLLPPAALSLCLCLYFWFCAIKSASASIGKPWESLASAASQGYCNLNSTCAADGLIERMGSGRSCTSASQVWKRRLSLLFSVLLLEREGGGRERAWLWRSIIQSAYHQSIAFNNRLTCAHARGAETRSRQKRDDAYVGRHVIIPHCWNCFALLALPGLANSLHR